MRRVISMAAVIALAGALVACAKPMTICGITYDTHGLFNQDEKKNPDIQYEVVWGNVIWAVVLFETIIAPIYFFGFSMFQPVGMKPAIKGAIAVVPHSCPGESK